MPDPETLEALGITKRQLTGLRLNTLTPKQRAALLGVKVGELKTPFELSPAKPRSGKASLTLYSCTMFFPEQPDGTGTAFFNSAYQGGGIPPIVALTFPRPQKGHSYLVEFHVKLFQKMSYTFRLFNKPIGETEEVTRQGGKAQVFTVLIPPMDEEGGKPSLGADLQQQNPAKDGAGWALYSVRVSTTQ